MEDTYVVFYVLGGAALMAVVISGVKFFNEWIEVKISDTTRDFRKDVVDALKSLTNQIETIKSISDIMDDKVDTLTGHVDKLERDMAEMKKKIDSKPVLREYIMGKEKMDSADPIAMNGDVYQVCRSIKNEI